MKRIQIRNSILAAENAAEMLFFCAEILYTFLLCAFYNFSQIMVAHL